MLIDLIIYADGVQTVDARTMKENDSVEMKKKEELLLKKEELLLNSIAVCTNITFYSCNNNDDNTQSKNENQLAVLSRHLSNCLFHDNEEILLESARALGTIIYLYIYIYIHIYICLYAYIHICT
jgi:hypothetical protein